MMSSVHYKTWEREEEEKKNAVEISLESTGKQKKKGNFRFLRLNKRIASREKMPKGVEIKEGQIFLEGLYMQRYAHNERKKKR
jgi:hypothetical protein